MTPTANGQSVTDLTWTACLLAVVGLAALGVMTARLDRSMQEFAELGVALPPFTVFLIDLPRSVYVLFIACLAGGLLLNHFSNFEPSTKLTINLLVALTSIVLALLMWLGVSFFTMGGIKRLSESG